MALKTEREPTVLYEIRCPEGMKMRLASFHIHRNTWKKVDVSKLSEFNDKTAHELRGTKLKVCGSGYVLFYSDEYNNGMVFAFSDSGANKIGGKIVVNRMPTSADGQAAWQKMDNAYAGEKVVDEVMGVRLIVKNCRGDPATGYYRIEYA